MINVMMNSDQEITADFEETRGEDGAEEEDEILDFTTMLLLIRADIAGRIYSKKKR